MLSQFQWISLICILLVALAGGFLPLSRRERARSEAGFPLGQAFAAGVFLALSLTIMLPSGFHLLGKAFPQLNFPLASLIAILAYLVLLSLEHWTIHLKEDSDLSGQELSPPLIPVIMTIMIAVPSFFLGAALGVSGSLAAVLIFIAIVAHKGSAGFALALNMARSTMTRGQTYGLYLLFVCSTPLGIVVGGDIHHFLSGSEMVVVKGMILSLAAGTFLYMGTLHEMRHTPLIKDCGNFKGFVLMLIGFGLTALVRFLMGEAHQL